MTIFLFTGARLAKSHGGGMEEWLKSLLAHVSTKKMPIKVYSYGVKLGEATSVDCEVIAQKDMPEVIAKNKGLFLFTHHLDLLACKEALKGQKSILIFHGHTERELKFWSHGWRWQLERFRLRKSISIAMSQAHQIVTVSEWMKDWLEGIRLSTPIKVIANCIPDG